MGLLGADGGCGGGDGRALSACLARFGGRQTRMSNRIAFVTALILIIAIAADLLLNNGQGLTLVLRKFLQLLYWARFWR